MYLKRLEIKGFKSFANKTVLEFLPPANDFYPITAIVGPNGSGKSNISDAIRWVMGEQSLKTLRGKKSEDVIFSGSESKGQLGMAEVEMVLDNSDGSVMEDFPEIVVTRRLYRSGEGEFLINNNPVRLLDVHLLLAKAQFARHSYTVVGQGMIDKMLTISPSERKDFLDEAAGIKEFKIKQHQAKLKLVRSVKNIEEAERLLDEVQPRLKLLSRQVKKLNKRKEVEIELRESQESYYAGLFKITEGELGECNRQLAEVEGEYEVSFKELKNTQNELANIARGESRQEVFEELQRKHQSRVREKNELERDLAVKEGQMKAEYGKEGKQNVGWLEEKLSDLKKQKASLEDKLSGLRSEEGKILEDISLNRASKEAVETKRAEKKRKINDLENRLSTSRNEQSFRRYSGLLAAQSILERKKDFGGTVHGLLAELGEAPEEYRLALNTAAGSYLSALVVDDDNTARLAIQFLRDRHLGASTFLPLNKIRYNPYGDLAIDILSHPGAIGLAVDLIKYNSKFDEIFKFVFKQTVIVKNLQAAQAIGIGRERMVTLTGDVADKSGVMRGGYRENKNGALSFGKKIFWDKDGVDECYRELKEEREDLERADKEFEEELKRGLELESRKAALNDRAEMLEAELNTLLREIGAMEQDLELLKTDPDLYGQILNKLDDEKEVIIKKIAEKENEIESVAEEIKYFNESEEEKKRKVFALQDKMQTVQNEINKISERLNELKVQIARLETKSDGLKEEVMIETGETIESIVDRGVEPASSEKLDVLSDKIQKLKYQLSLIGGIDESVLAEHAEAEEKNSFLVDQITDLNKAIKDLEDMIEELEDMMKKKSGVAFKKIRDEFCRYVKILFDGGSADMKQIYEIPESEDEIGEDSETGLFEGEEEYEEGRKKKKKPQKVFSGVDISINPPGKKIKDINSLSGGERTLASIALICAVLSHNPSPFVVLDEVEAALDEANTRRFARILAELSTKSQFILITHNRVTMHSAETLYGVTMGEDGISKLLSVNLERG